MIDGPHMESVEPTGPGRAARTPFGTLFGRGAGPARISATERDEVGALVGGGPRTSMPWPTPAVELTDAGRSYGSVVALQHLSLSLPFGSLLGVIGPSGAGKTTMIRLITGALAPTSGAVRVLGEDPRHVHRRTRERIGYMPQSFVLYPDLTAGENVAFVASLFGLLFRRRRARVKQVLQVVDLWDVRKRRASQLSGGMQRRLELACALVHEPAFVVLDEPTAGLDPLLRQTIWTELHRLRSAGTTVIVTTQYVGEAEECDIVALIAHGQLVSLAPPEELRRQAMGGEVIEIETTRAFDGSTLKGTATVIEVHQPGPRQFWLSTTNAGAATPLILEAIAQAGGEVVFAREYRPSFDEVFAMLVDRGTAAETPPGDAAPSLATVAANETGR